MKRESYLASIDVKLLFILLEQNQKEIIQLKMTALDDSSFSKEQRDRLKQLELNITFLENIIVERYLNENISLHKAASLLKKETGVKERVYKKLFFQKLMSSEINEITVVDSLKEAIEKLDVEQLHMIIAKKENNLPASIALDSYHNRLFQVEEDVFKELLEKIQEDKKIYRKEDKK